MRFETDANKPEQAEELRAVLVYLAKLAQDANGLVEKAIGILLKKRDLTGLLIHSSVVLLTRHAIEMADGVSILVEAGCSRSSLPLLRSQLEATLGILFILEKDSDQRHLCYILADIHKKIKDCKKYSAKTKEGREFARLMAADYSDHPVGLTEADADRLLLQHQQTLQLPKFLGIQAEWKRMKMGGASQGRGKPSPRPDPQWYALFHGPSNVRELSRHLKMLGWYEWFYRPWSDAIHAGDAVSQARGVESETSSRAFVLPIRNPEHLQSWVNCTVFLSMKLSISLVERFAPEEIVNFCESHLFDVRNRAISILDKKLINVNWGDSKRQ